MKRRYLEIVVGLVFVIALVLLGVFTIVIGDFGFLYEKHVLVVTFERVEQLDTGDLVTYRGKMSGKVNRITLTPKGVEVELSLREALALYQDYEIAIEQGSLLGRKIVTINPGHPPEPARPPFRGVVKALIPGLGDIGSKLNEAIDNINQLATDARTGKGAIARLIQEPDIYDSLKEFTKNLADATRAPKEGEEGSTVAKLLHTSELHDSMTQTFNGLAEMVDRANRGEGLLGKLAGKESDEMYTDLRKAVSNVRNLTDRANDGQGLLGKLLGEESDKAYADLEATLESARSIAEKADKGSGTIADLLNNPETRDSIRTAAKNLEEITTDIREGKGTLAQFLTKDEIYEDIKAAAANVRLATSAESKGTLARLLHDEKLYENVNNLVLGVKDFLEDMKQSLPASTILFLLPGALQ